MWLLWDYLERATFLGIFQGLCVCMCVGRGRGGGMHQPVICPRGENQAIVATNVISLPKYRLSVLNFIKLFYSLLTQELIIWFTGRLGFFSPHGYVQSPSGPYLGEGPRTTTPPPILLTIIIILEIFYEKSSVKNVFGSTEFFPWTLFSKFLVKATLSKMSWFTPVPPLQVNHWLVHNREAVYFNSTSEDREGGLIEIFTVLTIKH